MTKRRVGTERGKATVNARVGKAPKPANTGRARGSKAAAGKFTDTASPVIAAPPVPIEAKKDVPSPMIEAAPTMRRVGPKRAKTAVKAKPRKVPRPADTAPARSPEAAAGPAPPAISVLSVPLEIEAHVPSPPVEAAPTATATMESGADVATESSQPPSPSIDVVSPMPAVKEVDVTAEFNAAFETAPIEFPSTDNSDFVDQPTASAGEQSAVTVTGDDDRSKTPTLETFLVSVPNPNPLFKDAPAFVTQNLKTMVRSSSAAASGLGALNHEIAEFGWRQFDEIFAAWKVLLHTRSPAERFQSQCDYACGALEGIFGQGSKVMLAMLKLASEVTEPVARQYAVAFDRTNR